MAVRFGKLEDLAASTGYTGGGQFVPTLVMGLGGSGVETVRRIKRVQNRRYGRYGIIRYLMVDTDQSAYAPQPDLADADAHEQASIVARQAVQVYREMREGLWPQIEAFLPNDVDVSVLRNADGAGGIRPVGRFALFSEFDTFYNRYLHEACANVLNVGNLVQATLQGAAQQVQIGTEPRIYIVGSVCGGTGSSIFLDAALLVRHMFHQSGIDPSIVGVFYLPSTFRNEPNITQPYMQTLLANGYAGLLELEAFCEPGVEQRELAWEYPQIGKVPIEGPLFDECYLVEGTNAQGMQLSRRSEVVEMTARSLCVDIGSPVGARARASRRNTSAIVRMNPCRQTGKVRLMNGLATTGLAVPAAELVRHGCVRAARAAVHDHLLGNAPDLQALESHVSTFLGSNNLEERGEQDLLIERLLRTADGDVLAFSVGRTREQLEADATAQGERGEAGQARYVAAQVLNQLNGLTTDGIAQARSRVQANRAPVLRAAADAIRQETEQTLRRAGVWAAEAFLVELERSFTAMADELTAEATEYQAGSDQVESDLKKQCQDLREYGSILDLVLRPTADESMMDSVLNLLQRHGAELYRNVARSAAVSLLNSREPVDGATALIPQVQEWLRQVKAARTVLEQAEALAAADLGRRQSASRDGSTYVLEQRLIQPSEYDQYLQGAPTDPANLARLFWDGLAQGDAGMLAGVAAFDRRAGDLIEAISLPIARDLVSWLEQHVGVLQVIEKKKKVNETTAEYIRRQIQLMFNICQPFWTTNTPPGMASYERFVAMTVPCRSDDQMADEVRAAMVEEAQAAGYTAEPVDADYPFTLEISARAYGARAYYLRSTDAMKVQYDAKRQQPAVRELLHVDRRFAALFDTLHPTSPREQGTQE